VQPPGVTSKLNDGYWAKVAAALDKAMDR
jgi:hypothetical protein